MKRLLFSIGLFALAATASATTIVSDSGTSNGQAIADWIGESWTQTGSYTAVTITANFGASGAGTAYLMNHLGPGTTAANQIASPFAFSSSGSNFTLFSGLTLGPGTYYLLVDESTTGWIGTSNPTYTTDAGVSNISSFTNSGTIAGYSPATTYTTTAGALFFSVTGTPASATPEPATLGLLPAPLAGLVLAAKRRK